MLLHEARFRARSPWAAMLLWQAIALAGGLSMVGAPMVYGLAPFGDALPEAINTAIRLTLSEDYPALGELEVHPWHIFALCLGLLLAGHLVLTVVRTYLRVLSARRRHRQLVSLLSTPLPASDGGSEATQVIEHETPLAYCLPGRTNARSVTVLSRGLLETLTEEELAAVVAHEKTHLRQRHHLLTMAFEAWYRALPWLPTTRHGREAVLEITEMLADDGALATHSREDLLRALAVSGEGSPDKDLKPTAEASLITGVRLQRLLVPKAPLGTSAIAGVVFCAAALLAVPTSLLLLI
ncbi:M56 family metallopeptidase [Nesterenkonia sp. MY13]|uniref:M56 family metallopeptidase n=2 Tax=Nesterenkonia sedimenti TaxID=1463632 RepID=A0A7X8YCP3_9MICC|nr:M56 family metallopeptidase [Nesterenkonia sedimenti]